jgi:phenylalanyl-tRNA synthetase beta chain
MPRDETRLAVVLTGSRQPGHWAGPAEKLDLWDVKGLLEALIPRARLSGASLVPGVAGWGMLTPGAALSVQGVNGSIHGAGGRVREGVVDAPPWAGAVWGIEVVLPTHTPAMGEILYHPLPQHPAVERDLALLLPGGIEAEAVRRRIEATGGAFLESVRVFDLYGGQGIPEGFRSVAYRLVFRAADRTLVEADVAPAVQGVLHALKEEPGVQPRQ